MKIIEELSVVTAANWVPGPQQGNWTYDDYAALPDDGKRYEIVNGVLFMSPAPNPCHQSIVGMIFHYLVTHVQLTGLGLVFMAPLDVELSAKNVCQPDVMVILNAHLDKVTKNKIIGAPDLVVEVASPSTRLHDRRDKSDAYARADVPEYWIVLPERRTVEVFVLEQGVYRSLGVFMGQATLPSQIVSDLPVCVEQFFIYA